MIEAPVQIKATIVEDDEVSMYLAAVDVLKRRGWMQGDLFEHGECRSEAVPMWKGAVCLIGSLCVARGQLVSYHDYPALRNVMPLEKDGTRVSVADWNDLMCTTAEEAISKLREAAFLRKNT